MTQMIREYLQRLWRKQAKEMLALGTSHKRLGFVCCWPNGSPILPEYMSRHYRDIIRQSELPYVQLRNLRDSAATLLHRKGYDAKSIQGLLGHSDASTTANIYIHSGHDDLQNMVNTLDQTLSTG